MHTSLLSECLCFKRWNKLSQVACILWTHTHNAYRSESRRHIEVEERTAFECTAQTLPESQGGAFGCRSGAILPSGSFNSLQLDTLKKLFIAYGNLSISAVLAAMHSVSRLPLAIKLFLSDYLLLQTAWSPRSKVTGWVQHAAGLCQVQTEFAALHKLHFLNAWGTTRGRIWGMCKKIVGEMEVRIALRADGEIDNLVDKDGI